jgi:hypothetical protein
LYRVLDVVAGARQEDGDGNNAKRDSQSCAARRQASDPRRLAPSAVADSAIRHVGHDARVYVMAQLRNCVVKWLLG